MTLEEFAKKYPDIDLELIDIKKDGVNPEKPDDDYDQVYFDTIGIDFCEIYISGNGKAEYALMGSSAPKNIPIRSKDKGIYNTKYMNTYGKLHINPGHLKKFKLELKKEQEAKEREQEKRRKAMEAKIKAEQLKSLKQRMKQVLKNFGSLIKSIDEEIRGCIPSVDRDYRDPSPYPQYMLPVIHSDLENDPNPEDKNCKIYFKTICNPESYDDYFHIYASADGEKDYKKLKKTFEYYNNDSAKEKFIKKYKNVTLDKKSVNEFCKVLNKKPHFIQPTYDTF